ncbi:hypothetical protein ACOACO_17630 [Nocardioides sp. CPCC 205120]|uniref:hypothetical protein n=1 Tax=Nocardioides sp. CPCC 205120 TaxID=3406462 RepID=UPI003B509234
MKARVSATTALGDAIGYAAGALRPGATVRLTAAEGELVISGREPGISRSFTLAADVDDPGECVVSARAASAVLTAAAHIGVDLVLEPEDQRLWVTAADHVGADLSIDVAEPYAVVPGPEVEWISHGTVTPILLNAAVAAVGRLAEVDGMHAVLGGVHLVMADGALTATASERHLVGRRTEPLAADAGAPLDLVLPARELQQAVGAIHRHTVRGAPTYSSVQVDSAVVDRATWLRLTTEHASVTLRAIDQPYPTIPPAPAPVDHTTVVIATLLAALDNAAAVSPHVAVSSVGAGVLLKAQGPAGTLAQLVPATSWSVPGSVTVTVEHLVLALELFEDDIERVVLAATGPTKPLVLSDQGPAGPWTVTVAARRDLQR